MSCDLKDKKELARERPKQTEEGTSTRLWDKMYVGSDTLKKARGDCESQYGHNYKREGEKTAMINTQTCTWCRNCGT